MGEGGDGVSEFDDGDLAELSAAVRTVGRAIKPPDAMPGHDETGGTVDSLTEAMMGVTAGLCRIASAIERLAEAVEDHV